MSEEVRLPEGHGGIEVWRSGDHVLRTAGPWTPTVHAFLDHLEEVGFDGAPRALATDAEGREVLTFIDGDVLAAGRTWEPGQPTPWPQYARSEACLLAAARLMRRFHDASASFVLPEPAIWRQHNCPGLGPGEIVCHGDLGPHNTVYRDGLPVALIDWDGIRPNDPLVEFGAAAWKFVPLGDDLYFEASDFPRTPDLARRLMLFAGEYGVADPDELIWCLHQAKQRSAESAKYWSILPAQGAAALRLIAADLEWLDQNAAALTALPR